VTLVLDTGVIYAALDEGEPAHEQCRGLLEGSREQLLIPSPVLVELDYLLRKYASADAWAGFCEDIRGGAYGIWQLDAAQLVDAADLETRYADLRLGLVDAAVFSTCDLLGEDKVATLDHRHFSTLRTKVGKALQLLPERP
jgi:predicted nucleic acid-binding protein